jgi:hypothetical protein
MQKIIKSCLERSRRPHPPHPPPPHEEVAIWVYVAKVVRCLVQMMRSPESSILQSQRAGMRSQAFWVLALQILSISTNVDPEKYPTRRPA